MKPLYTFENPPFEIVRVKEDSDDLKLTAKDDRLQKRAESAMVQATEKLQDQVEELTGDREKYITERIVVGWVIACFLSPQLRLRLDEFERSPITKVADIPTAARYNTSYNDGPTVDMEDEKEIIYTQLLVSRNPLVLVMHYTTPAGRQTVEYPVDPSLFVYTEDDEETDALLNSIL